MCANIEVLYVAIKWFDSIFTFIFHNKQIQIFKEYCRWHLEQGDMRKNNVYSEVCLSKVQIGLQS